MSQGSAVVAASMLRAGMEIGEPQNDKWLLDETRDKVEDYTAVGVGRLLLHWCQLFDFKNIVVRYSFADSEQRLTLVLQAMLVNGAIFFCFSATYRLVYVYIYLHLELKQRSSVRMKRTPSEIRSILISEQ